MTKGISGAVAGLAQCMERSFATKMQCRYRVAAILMGRPAADRDGVAVRTVTGDICQSEELIAAGSGSRLHVEETD